MTRDWSAIDNRLNDPTWYGDRDAYLQAFKLLRDEDPVHWAEDEAYGRSFWALTRHEHIKAVLADHSTFSSRHMWTASRPPRSPRRFTLEQRYELGLESRVSNLDPPMHTYLRRPVNKHFSIPAIGRLSDDIQGYADEIVARMREVDTFDLIEDVATTLPLRVVLRLLGVPESDWPFLQGVATRYTQAHDPRYTVDGDPLKTAENALRDLIDYAMNLAEDRQKNPQEDFATVMTNLTVEGEKFSSYELRGWFSAIIIGGLESSRNAIGTGLWQMIKNPEQRAAFLDASPSESANMVDEVIRWTTPGRGLLRVATRDVELGGKDIRQGDWVMLYLIAGNHDDRVFENPERFDLSRTPNDHLGLGEGVHKCLGRNLLRLEFTVLARTLLSAFPDLEVISEPEWVRDVQGSGLTSLKVRTNRSLAAAH